VKRFKPNANIHYAFVVYNASLDVKSSAPNLVMETKLFRDGKRVYEGPETVVDVAGQTDLGRILVSRVLRLGPELEPGHYYLQLAITDKVVDKDKQPPAVQWVDFEIVK
jgi:hypothetical protein